MDITYTRSSNIDGINCHTDLHAPALCSPTHNLDLGGQIMPVEN